MKCQVYIARLYGSEENKTVRIDAKDGPVLLGRIDIAIEDFAKALLGQGGIPAEFSTVREIRKPKGQQ